jgi:hypothetical protein
MTANFRNSVTIALACVAVAGQSELAAGQQSDQARFQAYRALSSAATSHFVVNKDAYLSYTVEPADDVCTIVVRNAKYALGRITIGEVILQFGSSNWSTSIRSGSNRGVEVRSAKSDGVTVNQSEYAYGEEPVVHAPSRVAATVIFPVRQTDEAVLALKTALDRLVALCKDSR